jgi:hypothetical protein
MSRFGKAIQFNTELKGFLKNLILVFPDDRDIKKISSALNIAMMDDPEGEIAGNFLSMMNPYSNLILERNDTLFSQDPENLLQHCGAIINHYQTDLIKKLHIYWEVLNEENKEIVWEHMQNLYNLASQIHCVQTFKR